MRITRLTAFVAYIVAFVQVAFASDSTTRLRFEIDILWGYICLQARVNENREPEWFVFDTGGSGSLFLLPKAASRLNISYDKEAWQAFSEYSTVRGGYRVPEVVLRFDGDIIPIAQSKFTKTSMPDNPLLKVPPASRGNRTHAPHAVPLAKRGEPAGGGQL